MLVFAASGCAEATTDAHAKRPNILLILVDSLRADHLGRYGYERDTSPFFDAFSERGVLFENAYSHSSHTKVSVASILTGLQPRPTVSARPS